MGLPRPSLDLPDPAKPAALPLAHHIIDLLAAMPTPRRRHDSGQPHALRSDLDHAARSNFQCVPNMITPLLG